LARRATQIKAEREAAKNLLLLDAGDTFHGEQGLSLQTKGRVIVEAMNLLGYDAMTLGAPDFSIGMEELNKRIAEADFPILSANVIISETGKLLAQPYVIKDLDGHQAAIIGLTNQEATTIASQAGSPPIRVLDPIETARQHVAEVGEQADIIIILSYLGQDTDRQLAAAVEGIDIIIGGLDGIALAPPLQDATHGTLITQTGPPQGKTVGVLRLKFDGQGTVTEYTGQTYSLTPDFADDPEMREFLNNYQP
jgi:2',3'-cyclic-nucleotide 2'-phosphodiesterase (5'-nucleotidase family)